MNDWSFLHADLLNLNVCIHLHIVQDDMQLCRCDKVYNLNPSFLGLFVM